MADKAEGGSPLMDFTIGALKKNKNAAFAEIRDAAQKKGLTLYPITYGRAKALLGLVKTAPRGQGKARMRKAGRRGPGRPPKVDGAVRRGPGRPRRQVSPVDSLQGLIGSMRDLANERDRLRSTLEKVRQMIADIR